MSVNEMNNIEIPLHPDLSCDIVMKGGVTSGIIYPNAVVEIAKKYRFACIGGTSAGAIAASLTAAAEYRRRNGSDEGFKNLSKLSDDLFQKENNVTKLLSLFEPASSTKRIFKLFLILAKKQGIIKQIIPVLFELIKQNILVSSILLLFLAASLWGAVTINSLVLEIITIVSLCVSFLIFAFLLIVFLTLRKYISAIELNNFGLTKGFTSGKDNPNDLTRWLYELLQKISDKGNVPLTFGDLRSADPDKDVNLSVMTTNLSYGLPYVLPFDAEGSRHEYFFDPEEFNEYFPSAVVQLMVKNSKGKITKTVKTLQGLKSKDLYSLPDANLLPVIVPVRMSLSFPVLLSAVPLYIEKKIKQDEDENETSPGGQSKLEEMKRCWFSDGGICSNIPVHLFDSPIPSRPTFVINLREFPDYVKEQGDEALNIFMPRNNREGLDHEWNQISFSLNKFISSIMKTMQNWNDNSHLRIPGYRDRICTVYLTKEEGGLNLDMQQSVLNKVSERGRQSGIMLRERFVPPGINEMNWDNHRWIRFRNTIHLMTKYLRKFISTYNKDFTGMINYKELLSRKPLSPPKSYPLHEKEKDEIIKELAKLTAIVNQWGTEITFGENSCPKPKPELKIKPRL